MSREENNDYDICTCFVKLEKGGGLLENTKTDSRLIKAMLEYTVELVGRGEEIFKHKDNVCVTEKGYYMIVFAKDLKKA